MNTFDTRPFSEITTTRGLPPWAYESDELATLERELIFRRNWLFVGHINQIPNPGDYMCLNEVDERAIVVRDRDGTVRAFHNLCRHRGSRVVAEENGNAGNAIVCPFHGWCYNLDGSLRGAPMPETFPGLDTKTHGLKPVEFEVWHGLVFVRFKGDGPSVSELTAGIEDEVSLYRLEDMVPDTWSWHADFDLNWKSVMDVDNEGYHVPVAHPSLHALFKEYADADLGDGISRSHGYLNESADGPWSVRNYLKVLPSVTVPHLPESHQNIWIYFGLFPNLVITVYPGGIADVYQTFPGNGTTCTMRGAGFRLANDSRESRVARYLKDRIDRATVEEDIQLIKWSGEGMRSSAYDGIVLSETESGVQAYHDSLREVLPVLTLSNPPTPGTVAERNAALGGPAI